MGISYDFTKEPKELVEYLKQKGLELTFNYEEMMHEAHHKAFTVAKVTKLDLLFDIHTSLQEALSEGKPFERWQKEIRPTLQKKGWWGETEVTNPQTGEIKNIFVGSRRLKTIYDTNMRVAYAQGRYKSQMQSDGEYLYYSSVLDRLTRPAHSKMHGTLLPKTHKWWDTNYPPNGWRCRCKVRVYTKEELEAKGLKPSNFTPPNIADKDWAYNPGKTDNIEQIYSEKIGKIEDNSFQNAVELTRKKDEVTKNRVIANKLLNEMIDEVIVKKNQKYLANSVLVGEISQSVKKQAEDILGKEIVADGIVLEKNRLLHASPDRKEVYGQALRVEEMRQIVDVIDKAEDVYIDTSSNHQNIIYAFEDTKDKTKINLIPVEILKKIKKFGKDCFIITFDKQNMSDFEAKIKGNVIKKVK